MQRNRNIKTQKGCIGFSDGIRAEVRFSEIVLDLELL